jgi:hypothetical protein
MCVGGLSYIIDTVNGKIQPNRVSWLIWCLAPFIAFIAEIQQGVGIQSLATFIVGFIPILVFIATFVNKKAVWKLNQIDLICGFLSVVGLSLWLMTKVGNLAIFFSILADGLASIPTIIKSYYHPESESISTYLCVVINAGFALLIIRDWNFQNYAFPTYLFIVFTFISILIRFKLGKVITKTFKH